MKRWTKYRNTSLIDLSGLMDIIFILLIFVMLSVSFQKKISMMELDLPSSIRGADSREVGVEISLTADSKIFINRKEISLNTLSIELRKEVPSSIRLNAEKKVTYEQFIEVSEIIKSVGIEKIDLGLKTK